MTRRGKRRRGRSRQPTPQTKDESSQAPAREQASRRRRRRRGRPITVDSALQQMAGVRPDRPQTLPPDGLVLEDLISTMQQEYGTPSTPQEYRLVLKVDEESADVAVKRIEEPNGEPERVRLRRRRRRGRRSTLDRAIEEIPTEPEDPQEIPPVV